MGNIPSAPVISVVFLGFLILLELHIWTGFACGGFVRVEQPLENPAAGFAAGITILRWCCLKEKDVPDPWA